MGPRLQAPLCWVGGLLLRPPRSIVPGHRHNHPRHAPNHGICSDQTAVINLWGLLAAWLISPDDALVRSN